MTYSNYLTSSLIILGLFTGTVGLQALELTITGANNVQDDWSGTQGTSSLGTLSLPVAIQNQISRNGALAYTITGLDLNGVGGNNDSLNISFNVTAERQPVVTNQNDGSYLSDGSMIDQSDESLQFTFASLSVNIDGGTGNGIGTFDGFTMIEIGSFKSSDNDVALLNSATITASQDTGKQTIDLADLASIDLGWSAGNGVRFVNFDFKVTANVPEPRSYGLLVGMACFVGIMLRRRRRQA